MQFISCTATLANAGDHMKKMFGLAPDDIAAIAEDGAPTSQKSFLVWNPPLIDPLQPALGRASSMAEATGLMRFLMKKGVRVILFCKVGAVWPCGCLPSELKPSSRTVYRYAKYANW